MAISSQEAHKQYERGMLAFERHLSSPEIKKQFIREADGFMRSCAVGVWHADGTTPNPVYVEYYNGIYCKGNPIPSALYWELAQDVAEYSGFVVPPFFDSMLEYDRKYGHETAAEFVDLMTLNMLLFAAVDNMVSEQEAGFINDCQDKMKRLCTIRGVGNRKNGVRVSDFVTKKEDGNQGGEEPGTAKEQPATAGGAEGKQEGEEKPAEPEKTLEELLAELDSLVGLEKIKKEVRSLINLVKVREQREKAGLPVAPMSLHMVFMGNPGTGKTTVARLLSQIYHAIGILSKGQLVEVDRAGLVAGFVGQTAIKTHEAVKKAIGGVLFIDEAYALVNQENGNDFGHEAIEALLKDMEDNRKDLVVIVAGYTKLMDKFIHSNPGLESRFNRYMYFEDYVPDQLFQILQMQCKKNGYVMTPETEAFCRKDLADLYENRDENFGNGRDVRNLFENAITRQSNRLAKLENPTKEQLMTFLPEDFQEEEETEEKKDGASPEGAESGPKSADDEAAAADGKAAGETPETGAAEPEPEKKSGSGEESDSDGGREKEKRHFPWQKP